MTKLNDKLIKAGVKHLIKNDFSEFVKKVSMLICEKPHLIDFFFNDLIDINDDIKDKIEAFLKKEVPIESDFLGIVSIKVGFNWDLEQAYNVEHKVMRYYTDENSYCGQSFKDDLHPFGREVVLNTIVELNNLK